MSTLVVISLYMYFDGNCRFNRPRIYDEDDEVDKNGWIRGIIVLLFSIVVCCLKYAWVIVFFRQRRIRLALFIVLLMIVLNIVILWAMPTTDVCPMDTLVNRYWICFALYLIFTLWLFIGMIINLMWLRIVGSKLDKNHENYTCYKGRKQAACLATKKYRYPQNHSSFYAIPGGYGMTPGNQGAELNSVSAATSASTSSSSSNNVNYYQPLVHAYNHDRV